MNVSLSGIMIFLLGACTGHSSQQSTDLLAACPQLAETYFAQPLERMIQDFTSEDLDHQNQIYICGNQFVRPPALYLAAPFASQGSKAAAFLKYKIQNTLVSDLDLRDILQVFVEMERQQTYDVIADRRLMDLLRSRV
jgi:hypothetical protein